MADPANAAPAAGDSETVADVTVKIDGPDQLSARNAGRLLAEWRMKQQAAVPPAPEPVKQETSAPEAAPPAEESADEADASPPQEQPGETSEPEAVSQEPPIEPPVSWSRDAKEQWRSLPRETQEYLAQRESERDSKLLQSQREAKEQQKTLDLERQKMEQARQQYEQALPALVQTLQQSIAGDFPDIQSMADVEKLAKEDWARYIAWDAQQKKLAAITNEARAAQERQQTDLHARFAEFAKAQDKLFIERNPEFADTEKSASLQKAAVNRLKDLGFTEDELARHWSGQDALSLRDGRVQELIADAVRYRTAKAANKPVPKNLPPVARPGSAPAPNRGSEQEIRRLEKQLSQTHSQIEGAKLAVQLQQLRRRIAAR